MKSIPKVRKTIPVPIPKRLMPEKVNGVSHVVARYMIAYSQKDYDAIHRFLKGTEFEDAKMTFPTITATIDGRIEGVLATSPNKHAIVAGPIYIKDKGLRKATLELKLVDAYESLLINMGVSAYVFRVKKKDTGRVAMLKEIGLEPYATDDKVHWYMRNFYER